MTENKDKHNEKDKEKEQEKEKDKDHERNLITHLVDAVGRKSRNKNHSATMVTETEPSTIATTPVAGMATATSAILLGEELRATIYMTNCVSFQSEIFSIDVDSGEMISIDRQQQQQQQPQQQSHSSAKDESLGTQRVFKKTSPNCTITLYLPTREIVLSGSKPTILRGIVFVDPKTVQGYRIYAQLTLTFRYGREDEEVMGLRFCNEAIMSLHQVWPRAEEPSRDSLSPLQDALVKRLGEGAHPFTLNLTPQAPPSVQLVPAKRYYGAPIGTSYDVRCFIADKTEEKFHRRASVKMGVRVIYRTDVHHGGVPENFAALINSQASPPVSGDQLLSPPPIADAHCHSHLHHQLESSNPTDIRSTKTPSGESCTSAGIAYGINTTSTGSGTNVCGVKPRKSERGDSFPKLRLSPKSFRFSGRFGRSKSEIEKCPTDPFYNYSKSFQEYESGGPQGAVDKPFLLQEGRVSLRASLDKAWYTHGENVVVNVNIRNDSRKTVRKVRVCAIQHVDVCMFNNGKFKNIVADSDNNSPVDRTVSPGSTLTVTFILKPQRGPTKNWIALEDTLQRSTEPEEITGAIAASAIRSPTGAPLSAITTSNPEDRNVFAIYVSYYVKVKLSLSGMGGELSLKLPFVLVHVDESPYKLDVVTSTATATHDTFQDGQKLALANVPTSRKNNANNGSPKSVLAHEAEPNLDRIESVEDDVNIPVPEIMPRTPRLGSGKRKLVRSETLAKDLSDDDDDDDDDDVIGKDEQTQDTQVATDSLDCTKDIVIPRDDNNQASDDETYDEKINKDGLPLTGHQQIICAQVHSEV